MAARTNLPKIVTDVQDIVGQLTQEFESSHEPITDDSPALHRLCAKLEYLLTSSLKEKGVLASKRSYWHWMYSCLHRTKGLKDGLRYVQGNKEIRTSRGKGRALVRYCLVHQTLADSLQNCIMDANLRSQHLNTGAVLNNQTHAGALITSLYDLNAVHFDLNAKGYDLDSGWPTFASKCATSQNDQWAIQSHAGSLGSLTSASIMMEAPRLQGSGSSAPSSVDQRIEELVLELDQSDTKIQDQQDLISHLESKADSLERSTNEKEDILARVISDLEAKNRHLHEAMSHMTSEFQAREQHWGEKTENLQKSKTELEEKTRNLTSKVEQLETDKHNLEELVSRNLSSITSNFSQNSVTENSLSSWLPNTNEQKVNNSLNVEQENETLRSELDKAQQNCAKLEEKLNRKSFEEARFIEMQAAVEDQEERTVVLVEQVKRESAESGRREVTQQICRAVGMDEDLDELPLDQQVAELVRHLTSMSQQGKVVNDLLQQGEAMYSGESPQEVISSLKDENQLLVCDRDSALDEVSQIRHRWNQLQLEVENSKLQLEASRSQSSSRIVELEEELSLQRSATETLQNQRSEMLLDLEEAQEKLRRAEEDSHSSEERCKAMEEELRRKESDWNLKNEEMKNRFDDELCENEFTVTELQGELERQSSLNSTLDRDLEKEKSKSALLRCDLEIAQTSLKALTERFHLTEQQLDRGEEALKHNRCEMEELVGANEELGGEMRKWREEQEALGESVRNIWEELNVCLRSLRLPSDADKNEEANSPNDKDAFEDKDLESLLETSVELAKDISLASNTLKEWFKSEEKSHNLLLQQSECEKRNVNDELNEMRSKFNETNAEAEKLKLKLENHQEEKLHSLNLIEKLQQETIDLRVDLQSGRQEIDEVRLQVMEGSARELQLRDTISGLEEDVEQLKEKITDLLGDKDSLWKENEELKSHTSELEESLDEVNWVHDDDATKCSLCAQQFSITNRKHHCRMCGKIFCKSCSENWIFKKNKRVRVCKECVVNSGSSSMNVSVASNSGRTSPQAKDQTPSRSFDEISPNEVSRSHEEQSHDESQNHDDSSSFYHSFTEMISNTVSPSSHKEVEDVKSQDTLKVAARKEIHLPVLIEKQGITLSWNITSDLDINFRLFYTRSEGDSEQEVVPVRRIDSHIEPFVGQLVARQPGIYTIVLDNTYSRMTSKEVKYSLEIIS